MGHATCWEESDASLVARCKDNDWTAFDAILARYQDRVYGYVRRMVDNETDAEDITQEVFWKAFRALPRFREQSSLQTWLFRIATNLCRDWHRRRQREGGWLCFGGRRDEAEHPSADLPDTRSDPQHLVLQQELSEVLQHAILLLPMPLREVLVLHDIEAMPYEQIAQILGVPLGTVKSRLFYARARLRESLSAYVFGEEP